MTTEEKLLTAEEFSRLPDNGMRQELICGKVVEMPPPGFEHGEIMITLGSRLWQHVTARGLGRVVTGDSGIILARDPDTVRGPDVFFISNERLPPRDARREYIDVVPDLIVEIVSPSDRLTEVRRKVQRWLEGGARLAWTLHPRHHTVTVDTPGRTVVLHEGDTLTGEPVLPEFSVPVADLFPE